MNKTDFVLINYNRIPIHRDDDDSTLFDKTITNAKICCTYYEGTYTMLECLAKEAFIGILEANGKSTEEIIKDANFIAGAVAIIGGTR